MAERKVVLHWILGIEPPKRNCDLFGRGPACGAAIRQPEIAADAMDVCVDGDHELGGRDRPEAEVDAVRRANHPSRVEEESLARASGARVADQVTQTATVRIPAQRIGKTGQGFPEIPVACLVEVGEGIAEGCVLTKQPPGPPEHRRKMLSPVDAVDKPSKAATELCAARACHRCCGFGAQHGEHATDASAGGHRISEREARCNEPHDLLVARLIVAMDEIDRVAASGRLGVAACEQGVQVFADTVHFSRVLAILRSQLQ